MKRLIVVYNPRSSRFSDVQKNVLDRVHSLKGFTIGKYEIAPTNLEDNIAKLAQILRDDDLLLSAGGDATGVISANAIIKSKKDVTLAVLPFGNFNDLARTLGTKTFDDVFKEDKSFKTGDTDWGTPKMFDDSQNFGGKSVAGPVCKTLYPLEIIVDGKLFRYATCYVTIGMTAAAVELYDSHKMRAKLKTNFGRKFSSYTNLASWYFKNRHQQVFLPEFKLNGKQMPIKTTDYAAVNGRSMARVMKGGEDFLDPTYFRSETDRLASFPRLFKLMSRSIFSRIPGTTTEGDKLEFISPATFTLQAEGESKTFEKVKKIEIKKGDKCLKVITN